MTNEQLFELLMFEENLESAEVLAEEDAGNGATFIRARLVYPGFEMVIPVVHFTGKDWVFTPCDWQGWLPETVDEIPRIDWRVNATDTEGVIFFGVPMLAPWVPEPNGGPIEDARVVVGRSVREARTAAGLTVRELAEKAGLSHSHIVRIEAGKYNVTIDTLAKLCDALGMKFELVKE